MFKIFFVLIVYISINTATASAVKINYLPGNHLSSAAKELIERSISSRCSELLRSYPEISEVDSRTYTNGAPEETFDYYVVSSFNVRYLFDGTHPSVGGLSIAIHEVSNDRTNWIPALENLNFSGNGCN